MGVVSSYGEGRATGRVHERRRIRDGTTGLTLHIICGTMKTITKQRSTVKTGQDKKSLFVIHVLQISGFRPIFLGGGHICM